MTITAPKIEMTEEQTALLKPFADKLEEIRVEIRQLDESQLRALIEACAAATSTNCWARVFEAARVVERPARAELSFRRLTAA